MDLVKRLHNRLIQQLVSAGYLKSDEIRRAFEKHPRHHFLSTFYHTPNRMTLLDPRNPCREDLELIYQNRAIGIHSDGERIDSSTSEPGLMALMIEELEVGKGQRVMEIGTGTGYNAAILSELVGPKGSVFTVDIEESLVREFNERISEYALKNISVRTSDAYYGWRETSPFDRIIGTVGCTYVSPHWIDQLCQDGILLFPYKRGGIDPILKLKKTGDRLVGSFVCLAGFMIIRGKMCLPRQDFNYLDDLPDHVKTRVRTHPLFNPVLADSKGRTDFRLFLLISRADAVSYIARKEPYQEEFGFGVLSQDAESLALISRNAISLYGSQEALAALENTFNEWRDCGYPDLRSYLVTVSKLEAAQPAASPTSDPPYSTPADLKSEAAVTKTPLTGSRRPNRWELRYDSITMTFEI